MEMGIIALMGMEMDISRIRNYAFKPIPLDWLF
jgi:hypothetical protein